MSKLLKFSVRVTCDWLVPKTMLCLVAFARWQHQSAAAPGRSAYYWGSLPSLIGSLLWLCLLLSLADTGRRKRRETTESNVCIIRSEGGAVLSGSKCFAARRWVQRQWRTCQGTWAAGGLAESAGWREILAGLHRTCKVSFSHYKKLLPNLLYILCYF